MVNRRRLAAGFTLIELTVVSAILSIIVTAAVVQLPRANSSLEVEGRKVLAAIDLLSQQAIVHGTPHAIEVSGAGYRLREFRSGTWVDKRLSGIDPSRALPVGVQLSIDGNEGVKNFVMLPSGEMTARGFTLLDQRSQETIHYGANDFGRLVIIR